jgi:hypothetical protein
MCRRCSPCLTLFEVFELQFKLMDLLIQRLGGPAKLHPAQLVQLGLILRDEQMRAGQLGSGTRQLGFSFGQGSTQCGDFFERIHRS